MDQSVDRKQFRRISRRELLKMSPLLLLGGFAWPSSREILLNAGARFNDWAEARWYRSHHTAPTFADSEVVPLSAFPYNGYDVLDPEIDFETWRLEVSGLVKRPGAFTLAQIQALPRVTQNTRHVCVEGWEAIGNFGGARLRDFLTMIGAEANARFIYVECADDYYESLDMATAMQPNSLLCYEMYGKPLMRGHGAPLRLTLPTKIGYKSAKYLTKLEVTNVLRRRGYWEDQGYPWFYSL
ncbi:MAG TPA: molybdopterin-dependent oxidoreductase [Candidatus Binataceae bacterium]|nr:molybdopterin-dependent oxidoreductase [Candidatus Binataceae bacterium]